VGKHVDVNGQGKRKQVFIVGLARKKGASTGGGEEMGKGGWSWLCRRRGPEGRDDLNVIKEGKRKKSFRGWPLTKKKQL